MKISANMQALDAIAVSQRVTTNNIANVNTDGFRPSRADFETGPDGEGVRVADIKKTDRPGPLAPSPSSSSQTTGYVEASGTDISREMVNMIRDDNAYAANAVTVRQWDQTIGSLLDIKL